MCGTQHSIRKSFLLLLKLSSSVTYLDCPNVNVFVVNTHVYASTFTVKLLTPNT